MTGQRLKAGFDSEDRRLAVMASHDFSALHELLDDRLHYTHANGLVEGKAEFIAKLASDERKYLAAALEQRGGMEHDGFVVTFGRLTVTVRGKDGPVDIAQAYTALYVGEEPRLLLYSGVKL